MKEESMEEIALSPETVLAIEVGVKQGLKGFVKEMGDPRALATPDRTVEGMVINLTLELDKLVVGHDTDKAPTASIPLLSTLALMAKRMGATREAALKMLQEVMLEAIEMEKDASKKLMEEFGVAEAAQTIKEKVIGKLPRAPVKKMVTASGVKLTVTGVAQKAAGPA